MSQRLVLLIWFSIVGVPLISGCGTTTQKFATEQLLISDAVDQAVSEIDFNYLSGQDVYLDTKFLSSVKGIGFANTDYIISALRYQLSVAGCRIQEARGDAKIIVEPRVGALGTDGHEVTYGIPQTGQISNAAAALSSSPVMPAIPEISFGKSDKQLGVAKLMLFAYDRETKVAVWQSGLKKSESTSNNTWVLGAGPFQKGTIHNGFRFAGKHLRDGDVDSPYVRAAEDTILAAISPAPSDKKNGDDENADTKEAADRIATEAGANGKEPLTTIH